MTALRLALIAVLAVLAVLALAVAGCGSDDDAAAEETTTVPETTDAAPASALKATVGPGFDISVDQTSVSPGSYGLEIEDLSEAHNFHLTGPAGVDVSTDVAGEGIEHFTVELEAGTYEFVCDPHASTMNGTIEVG